MKILLRALFDPYGTLRGRPYWIGAGILIIVAALVQYFNFSMIVNAEDMGDIMQGSLLGMLLWFLIYPYFCLYGKRIRDIGHPATWFLLVLLIYVIFSSIAQAIVAMPSVFGEMEGMVGQMEKMTESTADNETPDFSEMMAMQLEMQKSLTEKIMWPTIISGAVVSAVMSGVIGVIKPKTDGNPFASEGPSLD